MEISFSYDNTLFLYGNGLCIASIPNKTGGFNLLESGILASNSLHFSSDNGLTWQVPKNMINASSFVLNDTIIYAINDGIDYSTDGGINWSKVNNPSSMISSFAAKDRYLLVGTVSNGIFLSKDNGTTWNAINNDAIDSVVRNSEISSLEIVPDGSGGFQFFVGTCPLPNTYSISKIYSHIFLSSNFGKTWNDVSAGYRQMGPLQAW